MQEADGPSDTIEDEPTDPPSDSDADPAANASAGNASGGDNSNIFSSLLSGFDTNGIMGVMMDRVMDARKDDHRVLLLNSMKPFLSEKRQRGLGDAIKLISLIGFFENFGGKAGK